MRTLILFLLIMMAISLFSQCQIEIDSIPSPGKAITINHSGGAAIFVKSTDHIGVLINRADNDGFSVNRADRDGLWISSACNDGITVLNAGGHSMNIRGSKSASTVAGHIGLVYNRDNGTNADVLALKVGMLNNEGNPGTANNFITFYNGSDVILGEVEGNGSGGVTYGSAGADYAEYMPVLEKSQLFNPGDIVGGHGGHISHATNGASQVMVITDRPAVLGNQQSDEENHEKVSFIGQVPVRVQGMVKAGDWIVASGEEDGTGIAIPPSQITLENQIVGRAWESNDNPIIKRVNTVVGLDHSEAKDIIIKNMQEDLKSQHSIIKSLQQQIYALQESMQ